MTVHLAAMTAKKISRMMGVVEEGSMTLDEIINQKENKLMKMKIELLEYIL